MTQSVLDDIADQIEHHDMVATLAKSGGEIADDLNANDANRELLIRQARWSVHEGNELDKIKKQAIYNKDMGVVAAYPTDSEPLLEAEQAHLLHMVIGIVGEAAELLEAVLSHIDGRRLDIANVIEELGDIEFYMEGFRQGVDLTRETTLQTNIQKLSKRYEGFNYSDTAAQLRADKA